jgi:hypothetical protein
LKVADHSHFEAICPYVTDVYNEVTENESDELADQMTFRIEKSAYGLLWLEKACLH